MITFKYLNGLPNKMANTLISLRVSNTLIKETNELVKKEGYNNLQEFIRASWREKVDKFKLKKSLLELEKIAGSGKGKKASKKELEAHILKVFG